MTEDVTLVVEPVRSGIVVSGVVPGPEGPPGPVGPTGSGVVPPTPNTLVQRDGSGSGQFAGMEVQSINSAALPPSQGLPSSLQRSSGGQLDPSKTYYYTIQYIWSDLRTYNFPEQTVVMGGSTKVSFSIQGVPSPPNVPFYFVFLQRTEVPGNYTDASAGVVALYQFTGSEIFPITITDDGSQILGQSPVNPSSTRPWSLSGPGFYHEGSVTAGSASVINDLSDSAASKELVYALWVRNLIAQIMPTPSAQQVGATFRSIAPGVSAWVGGSSSKVNVLLLGGQSNAMGANAGGPNPANPLVKVWDAVAGAWGSSDITQAPWSYSTPNGNLSKNNIGLALAHRLAEETGKPTFLIFYFVGGTSIDHWVKDGNAGGNGDYYDGLKARLTAALATPELAGKTTVDAMVFAQGEEDYTWDFATYLGKLTQLDKQLRAEAYFPATTPLFITGMSGLHDRYQITQAHQYFCANVNSNCRFVNSRGLQTQYDVNGDGTGDYTHWLGQSLWDFGHERIWAAYQAATTNIRHSPSLWYGRSVGPASPADPQIISTASSLVSYESRDLTSPSITSLVAGTGTLAWGYQCSPDGNYTQCLGYMTYTTNLCNYSTVVGRESGADDNGDYSLVSGYQNLSSATYSQVSGRGNTAVSSGSMISGTFCEFVTAQTDPVTLQHGVGTTTSNRKNSLSGRASGALRIGASVNVANLPSAANAGAGWQMFAANGNGGIGAQVISDGTNWRKLSEISGYVLQTATTGTVTLTPITSAYANDFSAVTPTGNITVSLSTTGAYAGARFEVRAPASLGSFTFTVNGVSRSAGSVTTLVYNGSAWIG